MLDSNPSSVVNNVDWDDLDMLNVKTFYGVGGFLFLLGVTVYIHV